MTPVDDLKETPSQTAGPYAHIGMAQAAVSPDLGRPLAGRVIDGEGEGVELSGVIHDGGGLPVKDALLEFWQADAQGRYNAPGFRGFARASTDFETGEWTLSTIRPGRCGARAPQILVMIFARGINIHLHTRIYFPDEAEANAADPDLARIEHRARLATMMAKPLGPGRWRFDIRLQGEGETVFFDV